MSSPRSAAGEHAEKHGSNVRPSKVDKDVSKKKRSGGGDDDASAEDPEVSLDAALALRTDLPLRRRNFDYQFRGIASFRLSAMFGDFSRSFGFVAQLVAIFVLCYVVFFWKVVTKETAPAIVASVAAYQNPFLKLAYLTFVLGGFLQVFGAMVLGGFLHIISPKLVPRVLGKT